jgi:hypothetical protein
VTSVDHIRNEPIRVSPSKGASRSHSGSPNASQNIQTDAGCCLRHRELSSHHSTWWWRQRLGSLRCDFGSTDGNGIDAHARSARQLPVRVKCQWESVEVAVKAVLGEADGCGSC